MTTPNPPENPRQGLAVLDGSAPRRAPRAPGALHPSLLALTHFLAEQAVEEHFRALTSAKD